MIDQTCSLEMGRQVWRDGSCAPLYTSFTGQRTYRSVCPAVLFSPTPKVIIPLIIDFSQRRRYFSVYSVSPGCPLDEGGWYRACFKSDYWKMSFSMPFVGLVGIRSLLRRPASEVSHICLNDIPYLLSYCFYSYCSGYLSDTYSARPTQCTNIRRCRSYWVYPIRLSLFRQIISFISIVVQATVWKLAPSA